MKWSQKWQFSRMAKPREKVQFFLMSFFLSFSIDSYQESFIACKGYDSTFFLVVVWRCLLRYKKDQLLTLQYQTTCALMVSCLYFLMVYQMYTENFINFQVFQLVYHCIKQEKNKDQTSGIEDRCCMNLFGHACLKLD